MDAVEYIKNLDKMCAAHDECRGCPLQAASGKDDCQYWAVNHPDAAVLIVDAWRQENTKTNLQKFQDVFGDLPVIVRNETQNYYGMPILWWADTYEPPAD